MAAIASWLAATAAAATISMQSGRELQSGFAPSAPMPPISTFGQQLMYGQLNTTAGEAYTVLGTRRINVQFDVETGAPAYGHMHLGFDPYVAASQYGFMQNVLGFTELEFFYNHSASPYTIRTFGNAFGADGYKFGCSKAPPADDFGNRYLWNQAKFAGNSTGPDGENYSIFFLGLPESSDVESMVLVVNFAAPYQPKNLFEPGMIVSTTVNYRAGAFSPQVSAGALSFVNNYMMGGDGPVALPPPLFTPPAFCSE